MFNAKQSDYARFRGKCKEECERLMAERTDLRLVQGWYYEPFWHTEEAHYWCEDQEGKIIDPTAKQFPSGGGEEMRLLYREYDGTTHCESCGKEIAENERQMMGRFPVCSGQCAGRLVGL